jgi:hypothetical protein
LHCLTLKMEAVESFKMPVTIMGQQRLYLRWTVSSTPQWEPQVWWKDGPFWIPLPFLLLSPMWFPLYMCYWTFTTGWDSIFLALT